MRYLRVLRLVEVLRRKITVKRKKEILGVDVRKVLRDEPLNEEILKNIPDFMLDGAVDSCVNLLEKHIISYIMQNRSRDPIERNRAITEAQEMLKELHADIKDLVQERVFYFSHT